MVQFGEYFDNDFAVLTYHQIILRAAKTTYYNGRKSNTNSQLQIQFPQRDLINLKKFAQGEMFEDAATFFRIAMSFR